MDILQNLFDEQIAKIPRLIFEQRIAEKLKEAGINKIGKLPQQIVEHILSGASEPFQLNEGLSDVSIVFSKEDFDEVEQTIMDFIDSEELSEIVERIVSSASATLLKSLKRKWSAEHAMQRSEDAGFIERLEYRWNKALNLLRMMLVISREWSQEVYDRKYKNNGGRITLLDDVILRLHVRACQVTGEIISLLESGFADGAMARWRTLHEIMVVASLISQYGADLAERYVAYQSVEAKRALDMYVRCHADLGYKPMSKRTAAKITADFERVKRKYGKEFVEEYGWAAHHIRKSRVKFSMLEEEVGHGAMRSHYKMASYNVHATPRGAFFKLGLLNDTSKLLGGRSNAGLAEPGQNAATSLTQISVLICNPIWTLDDIVYGSVMIAIRDQIPPAFARAETKLARDDRRFRATLTEE